MKAKIYDSGSIKTVLVQDDNGDKFITGLEELLDMMDGEDNWEIETTSSKPLTGKLYKYNKLTREVGEIRREIESYNTSKVFPVNELFKDFEMEHDKEIVDKYLKSNELKLGKIEPYCPPIHVKAEKFTGCTTRGKGEEPTLAVLYVTFDVKDMKGDDVPHFMLPSLTGNNRYIVKKEYSRDEIINQALHGGYLTREEMEEMGWKGDTPPSFSKDDVDKMVGPFKWMSFNIKVPKDLIVDDHPGE